MDLSLFWKGTLLGLAVAAPLGPIGALCINRTLERGFIAGVAGGLGTALADGFYAVLAATGFAVFSEFVATVDIPLRLVGGGFLLWLGWKSFRPKLPQAAAKASARNLLSTTATTFFLTIANPTTILSFAALFASLGHASTGGGGDATTIVAGVFAGSMLWWCILSGSVAVARHQLPEAFTRWVSNVSGGVLIAFGLWAITSIVR